MDSHTLSCHMQVFVTQPLTPVHLFAAHTQTCHNCRPCHEQACFSDSHCLLISGLRIGQPALAQKTTACSCATNDKQAVVPCVETYIVHRSIGCVCVQMDAAQQYNTNGRGYIPLLDWAKQHTQKLHAPPAGQQVVVTSGSNHAIDVSFSPMLSAMQPLCCPMTLQVCMCSRQILEQTHRRPHAELGVGIASCCIHLACLACCQAQKV